MLKALIFNLYLHADSPYAAADKLLRSLEPLELRSDEELLGAVRNAPEVKAIRAFNDPSRMIEALEHYEEKLHQRNIKTLCRWEDGYPPLLREIPDAPPILFYQGLLPYPDGLSIGMVGARKATPVGLQAARDFSRTLGDNGISVISGLAEGIDTASHTGALDSRGYTLAVLGCGLSHTYPASNLKLRHRILDAGGGVLSEFPPNLPARTWNFPRRNRIISGMASGVLVIEAGVKSGSLITARYALDQGRDIFAVPGSIRNPVSEGTNQLIKFGAVPVTEGQDLLDHYALTPVQHEKAAPSEALTPEEISLVKSISTLGTATVDTLAADTAFSVPQLLGHLAALEIKGAIERWITGEYLVRR